MTTPEQLARMYPTMAEVKVTPPPPATGVVPAPKPEVAEADPEQARLRRQYPTMFKDAPAAQAAPAPDRALMRQYPTMFSAEQKSAAEAAPVPAPGDLEIKLGDGARPDDPVVGEYRQAAGELGLDSAKAQRLYDLHQRAITEQVAAANAEVDGWAATTKADGEIGGPNLRGSLELAQGVLKEFGTPELGGVLDTGYGDHPELIRLLTRVGKALRAARKGS